MNETYDPQHVRPMRNWVSVLAEPRKQSLASGILLSPNESGLEKVSTGAGRIVRVGAGEKNEKLGIEAGDRVVYRGYLKHANPIPTEEKWEDGRPKEYFLMSVDDVYAIVPEDLDVSVISGRPQVPEKAE